MYSSWLSGVIPCNIRIHILWKTSDLEYGSSSGIRAQHVACLESVLAMPKCHWSSQCQAQTCKICPGCIPPGCYWNSCPPRERGRQSRHCGWACSSVGALRVPGQTSWHPPNMLTLACLGQTAVGRTGLVGIPAIQIIIKFSHSIQGEQ